MAKKKPATYSRFEQLAKKLLAVPKEELDRKMRVYNSEKKNKTATKKKTT
jgi:hypothetical protein